MKQLQDQILSEFVLRGHFVFSRNFSCLFPFFILLNINLGFRDIYKELFDEFGFTAEIPTCVQVVVSGSNSLISVILPATTVGLALV